MSERVHIWSNGTEHMIWQDNNCCRCIKYDPDSPPTCDLDRAILEAQFGDGLFDPEIAARLGYAGEPWFWCQERETEPKPAAREMQEAGAAMLPGFDA